jgi:hypothetical protein
MFSQYYAKGWRYYWLRYKGLLVPHWSEIRTITSSKTITSLFVFTTIIPLILKILPPSKRLCAAFHQGELCVPFELPFSGVVLFAAGVFAITSSTLFVLRCPRWVKEFHNIRDFKKTGMDSTELFEQSNRFFDLEYKVEAISRFFLYCRLMQHDRMIADIHADFDKLHREFIGAARGQQFSYPLIRKFVAEEVSSDPWDDDLPRDFAENHPRRFFWRIYRLQDSSRLWSRIACAISAYLALGCLGWILMQNIGVVTKYAFS